MECPRMYKRKGRTARKDILPFTATIMTTSTPSPTITTVELLHTNGVYCVMCRFLGVKSYQDFSKGMHKY